MGLVHPHAFFWYTPPFVSVAQNMRSFAPRTDLLFAPHTRRGDFDNVKVTHPNQTSVLVCCDW